MTHQKTPCAGTGRGGNSHASSGQGPSPRNKGVKGVCGQDQALPWDIGSPVLAGRGPGRACPVAPSLLFWTGQKGSTCSGPHRIQTQTGPGPRVDVMPRAADGVAVPGDTSPLGPLPGQTIWGHHAANVSGLGIRMRLPALCSALAHRRRSLHLPGSPGKAMGQKQWHGWHRSAQRLQEGTPTSL